MKQLLTNRYFYIAAAFLLGLVFFLQNNRPVTIDFFFWTLASANLLALMTIIFLLGTVAGFFANQLYRAKRKAKRIERESRKAAGTRGKGQTQPIM